MVEIEREEEQLKKENEIVQPLVQEIYTPSLHLPSAPTDWSDYEPSTPVTETLIAMIGVSGRPISTADFMRIALTHPQHGYYTNATTTKHQPLSQSNTSSSSSSSSTNNNESSTNTVNNSTVNHSAPFDDFDVNEWDDDDDDENNNNDKDDATKGKSTVSSRTQTVIGADFVTAPEISHVFGECLGVWFATQWQLHQRQQLDKKSGTNEWEWLELGPGKGTLMVDLLRFTLQLSSAVQNSQAQQQGQLRVDDTIPDDEPPPTYFGDGCRCIHFIERSPIFRRQQRDLLEQSFRDEPYDVQFDFVGVDTVTSPSTTTATSTSTTSTKRQIQVVWHDTFTDFLQYSEPGTPVLQADDATATPISHHRRPTYIVGQEFLDALPVYSFEKSSEGCWRERLVDVAVREDINTDDDDDDDENDRNANAPDKAADVQHSTAESSTASKDAETLEKNLKPRLRIVLAPEVTPPLRALLHTDDDGYLKSDQEKDTSPVGSVVEVCPEAILLVQDVATYIRTHPGSAALFIDYGSDQGSHDSLRGYSRHEQVPFLSLPGQVDITADVDFAALKHAIHNQQHPNQLQHRTIPHSQLPPKNDRNPSIDLDTAVRAFGPITQGEFLMCMGVQERIINLIERDDVTDDQAQSLYQALVRLASPEEMGERYKVLSIVATTKAAETVYGQIAYQAPAGF